MVHKAVFQNACIFNNTSIYTIPAPSNIIAGTYPSYISLNWQPSPNALYYTVASTPSSLASVQVTASSSIVFSGLTYYTPYTFTITPYFANYIAGTSAVSPTFTTTIYAFSNFTFTIMNAPNGQNTANVGPTSITYGTSTPGYGTSYSLGLSNGIQYWTVPATQSYTIIAGGGVAGTYSGSTGYGIIVSTTVKLNQGSNIFILVGQSGANYGSGSSGGGGTFIAYSSNNTLSLLTAKPILVAGGGGGGWNSGGLNALNTTTAGAGGSGGIAGSNGQGGTTVDNRTDDPGAGFYTNSGNTTSLSIVGGIAFIYGGANTAYPSTVFGGGGQPDGGGGGGYSGGGGTQGGNSGTCGGGGSFDINGYTSNATQYFGAVSQYGISTTSKGYNSGSGFVIITTSPTYVLDSLSYSAITSANALFGLKRLLTTYTGPVISLRRSTDNATSNFYADPSGTLWTGQNQTGQNFNSWIGGANAFVTVWYDQSGNGRHAQQSNVTTSQPLYNPTLAVVDFYSGNSGAWMYLPNLTVPLNNVSHTISYKIGTMFTTTTANGLLAGGNSGTTGQENDFYLNTSAYYWSQWGGEYHSTVTTTAKDTITYNYNSAVSSVENIYVNGTAVTTAGTGTLTRSGNGGTTAQDALGCLGNGTSGNGAFGGSPFNGQVYYISIFNSSLSTTDQNIVQAQ